MRRWQKQNKMAKRVAVRQRGAQADNDVEPAGVEVTVDVEGERLYTIDGFPVHRDLVFRELARHRLKQAA